MYVSVKITIGEFLDRFAERVIERSLLKPEGERAKSLQNELDGMAPLIGAIIRDWPDMSHKLGEIKQIHQRIIESKILFDNSQANSQFQTALVGVVKQINSLEEKRRQAIKEVDEHIASNPLPEQEKEDDTTTDTDTEVPETE